MNINILCYFLFGIAGGQEVDHTFVKFIIFPLTTIADKYICYILILASCYVKFLGHIHFFCK